MTNSKILRTISFFFAAVLAFSSLIFSVSAAENAVISLANASGKAGETVTISVNLSQNPGLIAMKLDVAFDAAKLELVGVSDTSKLNGGATSPNYEGGSHTLYWEDGLANANNTETGTIATMTFKLKEDCDKADVSISGVAYDYDLNTINVSASGSTITNTDATTATAPTTAKPTTTKPTTQKPTTTKNNTTTTKRVTTTRNTVVEFETESVETTEESTTDFLALFETTTEESTTEGITEESTTEEVEEEKGSTISRTRAILIVLFACLVIVGVAIIVSMVRKIKRG